MKNYGKILKELREEKKLSQTQLAEKLDISQSSLGRYELQQSEPRLSDIKKICEFFEITADYFIGLEDEAGTKIQNINQTFNFKF
ncbi:MAG: helix-turn-helix transcriptional regulator [Clostridia bacterium]|nr:helix-turn-helix transcriptional regulator [Clostridia bacterium]